jgi:hypothetical protein
LEAVRFVVVLHAANMHEEKRQMWTKLRQDNAMSVRETMIEIAGPPMTGHQSRWLEKVANAAHIKKSAARRLWRGEICPDDDRAKALRNAADLIKAKKEMHSYADKLDFTADTLERQDADFHGETIARCRAEAGRVRRIFG